MKKKKKRGNFFVIEGGDGCGKKTQTKILVDWFNQNSQPTETIDFPQRYAFFGKLIYEGLEDNLYGDFVSLHPKIASVLWAADRAIAGSKLEGWLSSGKNIVADRYVSANKIHQGGKIHDEKERKDFLEWLDEMEFGQFKIPRPDRVLYLDVPYEISQRLMSERVKKGEANPLKDKPDQHESNLQHQIDARRSAAAMLIESGWTKIQCSDDGINLLSVEEIHLRIRKELGLL